MGFPGGSVIKNLPANAGDASDMGSVSASRKSTGRGNGNPLQYSCLENFMERGAWQVTAHGVAKSQTWLSDWAHTHTYPKTKLLQKVCPKTLILLIFLTVSHLLQTILFGLFMETHETLDKISHHLKLIFLLPNFVKDIIWIYLTSKLRQN